MHFFIGHQECIVNDWVKARLLLSSARVADPASLARLVLTHELNVICPNYIQTYKYTFQIMNTTCTRKDQTVIRLLNLVEKH